MSDKVLHKSTENYSIVDHIHHHALNIAKLNNLVFWARTFFKIRKKCFVQINVFDNLFYRKVRSGPILRQKSALSSNLKRPASKSVKIMLGTTNKTSYLFIWTSCKYSKVRGLCTCFLYKWAANSLWMLSVSCILLPWNLNIQIFGVHG